MSRKSSFPGPLARGARGIYQPTDEQAAWLRRWYPKRSAEELAADMGIGISGVSSIIRRLGLTRTPAQMAYLRKRAGAKIRRANTLNGSYAAKKGVPLPAETTKGQHRYWQEVQAGVRESPWATMRREEPERLAEIIEQRRLMMREKWRRAKRNHIYCIKDDSRLRVVFANYTKTQYSVRYDASRLGYWWAEDLSDEGGFRYNIYYDDDTQRNERLEARLARHGFHVIDSRPHEE